MAKLKKRFKKVREGVLWWDSLDTKICISVMILAFITHYFWFITTGNLVESLYYPFGVAIAATIFRLLLGLLFAEIYYEEV